MTQGKVKWFNASRKRNIISAANPNMTHIPAIPNMTYIG